MTSQEAVLSSRIEGTQATLGEVLEFEAEGAPDDESTPKKADIREVLNCRAALAEAARLLDELAAAAAAGIAMVRSSLQTIDEQAKLAASLRTTTESMQVLSFRQSRTQVSADIARAVAMGRRGM